MPSTETRRQRRQRRQKQRRCNRRLKNRLFGHMAIHPCHWCKLAFLVQELTVEHILPLSLGGTNQDDNITLACATCNQQHGRASWLQQQYSQEYRERKQQLARKHYEQYSPEHRAEDEQAVVPNP